MHYSRYNEMLHKRLSMFSPVTNYFGEHCLHGAVANYAEAAGGVDSRVSVTNREEHGRTEQAPERNTGNKKWKLCHPYRSRPVGGARVVFTGNSATRAARDLWEASRLVNARVTTKTTNPSISSPSWTLWRESSWII